MIDILMAESVTVIERVVKQFYDIIASTRHFIELFSFPMALIIIKMLTAITRETATEAAGTIAKTMPITT
jgi:hypothetical protein